MSKNSDEVLAIMRKMVSLTNEHYILTEDKLRDLERLQFDYMGFNTPMGQLPSAEETAAQNAAASQVNRAASSAFGKLLHMARHYQQMRALVTGEAISISVFDERFDEMYGKPPLNANA